VLMPLSPATTMAKRFPEELATVLMMHGIDKMFIDREIAAMAQVQIAKTASRSLLGTMNDFSFLAEAYIGRGRGIASAIDPLSLSMRLADTPCSPIKYNSPARLLKETLSDVAQ